MSSKRDDQECTHFVICRGRERALWPIGLPVPNGWSTEGTVGSRRKCLEALGQLLPESVAASVCIDAWSHRPQ